MKTAVLSLSLLLAVSSVWAARPTSTRYVTTPTGYVESSSGSIFSDIEYVPVTRSEPNYSTITKNIPQQECWDEQVAVQNGGGGNDVIGGLVGAAIGGALGSQIGKGSGKTAATIGGAAIGTMMGQGANRAPSTTSYQTVRKCDTRYTTQTENVLSGYTNYAKFRGRDIAKVSDQPLKEIKITITYSY